MKIKALLATLAVVAASVSAFAQNPAPLLLVNVSGTAKYEVNSGATMKIVTTPVNAAFLCAAFGVSPKNYAVVFDTSAEILELVGKSSAAGLPTIQILGFDSSVASYNSSSPLGNLEFGTLVGEGATAGTQFASLSPGQITLAFKQKFVGATKVTTSVIGAVTTVATGASKVSLYKISFSGAAVFKPH